MTRDEIRDRIMAAIQPTLDRATRIIEQCKAGPGRHHPDADHTGHIEDRIEWAQLRVYIRKGLPE